MASALTPQDAPGFNRKEREHLRDMQRRIDILDREIAERLARGMKADGERGERQAFEWALIEIHKSRAALTAARRQ